jgi:hypothetical protein
MDLRLNIGTLNLEGVAAVLAIFGRETATEENTHRRKEYKKRRTPNIQD